MPVKIFPGWGGFLHDKEIDNNAMVWALLKNNGGYDLKQVKIKMKSEYQPIRDNPGEKSGRILVYPKQGDTILLLTSFAGAAPGPVNVSIYNKILVQNWDNQKVPPSSIDFVFGGKTYTLRVTLNDFKVILSRNNQTQVLYKSLQVTDPFAALEWVGDLDRDNKPDILIKTSTQYSYQKARLFLSSQAGKGDFVKQVGIYHSGE